MTEIQKAGRLAAIGVAGLFVVLSLAGIVGVWVLNGLASDVVVRGYGLIETGIAATQSGIGQVITLVESSRTEVQQAEATITTVGTNVADNSPVLTALNDRIETRLAPRVANLQQALGPVRDAVGGVASAVSFANSVPLLRDRAPRLEALDQTFTRLDALSADAQQLRGTLRGLVVERKNDVAAETVASLVEITRRIDGRLAEVQADVDGVRAETVALGERLEARKSRLLLSFDLAALALTLMLLWIVYTQVVVIRHHWTLMRVVGPSPDARSTQGL